MKSKIHENKKRNTKGLSKNNILAYFLLLLSATSISQEPFSRYVKKDKLLNVESLNDITPDLWRDVTFSAQNRDEMDELDYRRRMEFPVGYYLYPKGGYNAILDLISVEYSADCGGKVLMAKGPDEKLTTEQKNILRTATLGGDLFVSLQFKYKKRGMNVDEDKIIYGNLLLTVVPATEALFPGGSKKMDDYFMTNVWKKIPGKLSIAKFVIDEEGKVTEAKIIRGSNDKKADKLLLDAVNAMPQWTPGKDSKGKKVKQQFIIPLGAGGGC